MENEPAAKRACCGPSSEKTDRQRAAFDKLSRDDLERALRHASTLAALLAFEISRCKVDMGPLRDFVDSHVQNHLVAYKELQRQYNEPAVLMGGGGGRELREQMIRRRGIIEAYLSTFFIKE
jgi:hypothetical protein